MIGQTLSHYRIEAKLGAGGMGEVYRAHDEQLDRDVAIKVLPAGAFGDATARARLLREARTASKLNHPHICTVHEVGEANGQAYIAMELVEGETLSARLARGTLPAGEVLRLGAQLADALAHAHGRGVVHRDLKSANIVITPEGRAKVLDFGLARRVVGENAAEAPTQTQATLTEPGTIVGTLAYMAPEQLRGRPADARSDVWALGVVLYEMAGGARPFQGKTAFELSSAILNQPAIPAPDHVPLGLKAVIARCLEKEPERRYQRAGEVRAALEAIQTGKSEPAVSVRAGRRRWPTYAAAALLVLVALLAAFDVGGVRSRLLRAASAGHAVKLAVLPFEDLTGGAGEDYFSDGLTEEMIAQLGRLHPGRLGVIARTSAMRYKKTAKPIDQIGRELDVEYILEGSTRREGSRVRINTELIRVRDQTQLWADSYDRELSGILAVQADVARGVARSLALALLPDEQARLTKTPAVKADAYEAYLKGRERLYRVTAADLDTAQRLFELALEKDPEYALAYTGLATAWSLRRQFNFAPQSEARAKAKAAASKAIALDPTLAEAHLRLAIMAWGDWDWARASQEFKRTLDLNPNYADARSDYSHLLMILRRPAEAMTEIKRALELDPFNPLIRAFYGVDLVLEHRFDDAIAQYKTVLKTVPNHVMALNGLRQAFDAKQMYKEALAAERSVRAARGDSELVAALDRGYAEAGYTGAMRRAAEVLAARSPATPFNVAALYLRAGDRERAVEWLERAYEAHDANMPYLSVVPAFDPLRGDPRFHNLLRRMGLPPDR